jgi:hypothetical protein
MKRRCRVLMNGCACLLILAGFASSTIAAEVAAIHRGVDRVAACTVRGTVTRLSVECPTASVVELLAALQKATGLRSEYPQDVASKRVSVSLPHASLLEVLESALSSFNFAVWMDRDLPSVTWLRIVDLRGAVERPEQQRTYEQTAQSPAGSEPAFDQTAQSPAGSEPAFEQTAQSPAGSEPASSASMAPQNNEADMAWEREKFARGVTTTYPLEPPIEAGSGPQPTAATSESDVTKPPTE